MPRCFLHAADLHLDSPFQGVGTVRPGLDDILRDASLAAWDALVELCIDERAEFLLLAGDLFDSTARTARFEFRVRDGARRLREHGIRVFVVHGNHDPLNARSPLAGVEGVHVFRHGSPDRVTFDDRGLGDVTVHGVSFGRSAETENLAALFQRGDAPGLHVGLLHCSVGEREGHGTYAPCKVGDLVAKGFDYWALGHIHRFSIEHLSPPVVYAGALQGRSPKPSDRGPHGAVLVEFDGNLVTDSTLRPLDIVRFECVDVTIEDIESPAALEDRLLAAGEAALADAGEALVLLRARLVGTGPLHTEVVADGFAEGLRSGLDERAQDGLVWERIVVATRPEFDLDEVRRSSGFAGDLVRAFDALEANPEALDAVLRPLEEQFSERIPVRGLADEEPLERLWRARDLALEALVRHEGEQ